MTRNSRVADCVLTNHVPVQEMVAAVAAATVAVVVVVAAAAAVIVSVAGNTAIHN